MCAYRFKFSVISTEKISPFFIRIFQTTKLINLEDLLEDAYNALDDIWKLDDCNFPQDRMDNLFDIIGSYLFTS